MIINPENGIPLNPKQYEALNILLNDKEADVLLYGGAAAGGKSHLGALWLFFMCINYPNSRWFVARRQKKDILDSTYPSFLKVVRLYGDSDKLWKFNKSEGIITNIRNGATITFLATDYEPADPNFDRFGSKEFTGGWVEEAQETCRLAYNILNSRVGRCLNTEYGIKSKILLTCNPSRNWLYTDFYRPFIQNQLPAKKRVVLATLKDNQSFLPADYLERMNEIEDPTTRQRLTLGIWDYDDDPQFLISSKLLGLSLETAIEESEEITVGIDIGMGGPYADKTIIISTKGNIVLPTLIIDNHDYSGAPDLYDEWLAEKLNNLIDSKGWTPENVRIDANGVGEKIYLLLKKVYKKNVYGFKGGEPAIPRKFSKQKFKNLRAQCYWELKEEFRLQKIHFSCDYDELLWEELSNQKCIITDNTFSMEDKKFARRRLGRSPDRADALAMARLKLPNKSAAVMSKIQHRETEKNRGRKDRQSGLQYGLW